MRLERILWWCVLGSRPRRKISFSGEGCLWIWHPLEERIGYHGATQVGENFSMHFRNPTWIFRTSTSYPQKDVVFSPWITFSIGIDCVFRCLLKRDWFLPSVLHPFTFHQEIIALNRPLSHLEDDENIALFGWLLKMKLACSHPRETNGWNPPKLGGLGRCFSFSILFQGDYVQVFGGCNIYRNRQVLQICEKRSLLVDGKLKTGIIISSYFSICFWLRNMSEDAGVASSFVYPCYVITGQIGSTRWIRQSGMCESNVASYFSMLAKYQPSIL